MVLPGFIATEGFPATELRERALTRWLVSKPERVAEAILEAGPGGKAERYVPRPYALAAVARVLAPRLVRRVLSGGAAAALTTSTAAEQARPSGPLLELSAAISRQYLKPKTKLTLLAALLLRSARIFSWAALTLSSSFSALPTLREVLLHRLQEAEPLFEPGGVFGGARHRFDRFQRLAEVGRDLEEVGARALQLLGVDSSACAAFRIGLLEFVFFSQIGSTSATYSARVGIVPGRIAALAETAATIVAAITRAAVVSVPFKGPLLRAHRLQRRAV